MTFYFINMWLFSRPINKHGCLLVHACDAIAKIIFDRSQKSHGWFNRWTKICFISRITIQICGEIYKPTAISNDMFLSLHSDYVYSLNLSNKVSILTTKLNYKHWIFIMNLKTILTLFKERFRLHIAWYLKKKRNNVLIETR